MVSEQHDPREGAVAAHEPAQPAGEPEAPTGPVAEPAAPEPQPAPADVEPAAEPASTEPAAADAPAEAAAAAEPPAAAEHDVPGAEPEAPAVPPADPDAPADDPAGDRAQPSVGPKIVGVARERTLPVVKQRLQEKPKREPLPWPELRAAVAAVRADLDVAELKELFRLFPPKIRDEVTENVRGFRKGARRPVSQHAAKQLARAVHTARRQKKNSHPSGDIAEALGQAMAAELIASLEPEVAAEVILPKRDLLERESRQARRRARDEEDRRRDEQRRRRREDAKSSRQQTSFGSFSGAKIQGLDEIAAMFAGDDDAPATEAPEPAAAPEAPVAAPEAAAAAEPEAPAAEAPESDTPAAEAPETGAPAAEAPGEGPSEAVPADEAQGDEPDARPDEPQQP